LNVELAIFHASNIKNVAGNVLNKLGRTHNCSEIARESIVAAVVGLFLVQVSEPKDGLKRIANLVIDVANHDLRFFALVLLQFV